MRIEIAGQRRPYSHTPGTWILVPQSTLAVRVFPSRLIVHDIKRNEVIHEESFPVAGPLERFMATLDLERGCVSVFSEKFCYHITPEGRLWRQKKAPMGLDAGFHNKEKLSLGSHRQQLWQTLHSTRDMKAIFPLWHRMGGLLNTIPQRDRSQEDLPQEEGEDIFSLLTVCQNTIARGSGRDIIPIFKKLFLAAFTGILVPRLFDDDYQGITRQAAVGNPLYILWKGAQLIRSLFIQTCDNQIAVLPKLPSEFLSGRFVNLDVSPFGMIDMQWSEHRIRLMHFSSTSDGLMHWRFGGDIRSFRIRQKGEKWGKTQDVSEPVAIKAGNLYLLDQFQK